MTPWTIWFKSAGTETWHPLELYRSLPTGHYRVAARLLLPNKHLAWRWKFYPQVGEIQYFDFQGKTNGEGLISLLDLDTVEPGTWQFIGRPDVFDELCGETWQIEHQFQIIPNLAAALMIPPLSSSSVAANEIVPHPSEQTDLAFSHPTPVATDPPNPPETEFKVLAEPDFVPEEEISAENPPLRSVNYVVELIDPEKAATYQVDITVMQDDRRPAVPLDLPNPHQMVRLLHRPIPKPKSPLPPKLSKV